MLISFACRTCSQAYKVPVNKAGKHSRCARCKEPLAVPRPDQMWWRQTNREVPRPPDRTESNPSAPVSATGPAPLPRPSSSGMWALVIVVLVMSCIGIGVYVREKNEDRRRADEERDRAAEQ